MCLFFCGPLILGWRLGAVTEEGRAQKNRFETSGRGVSKSYSGNDYHGL